MTVDMRTYMHYVMGQQGFGVIEAPEKKRGPERPRRGL
jgi:hypothetical protein